jgi:hypothetical protein
VESVMGEGFSDVGAFEKMRRLNASTPLSVAGVRAILEEEEDNGVFDFARKGFRVGMVGTVPGGGMVRS